MAVSYVTLCLFVGASGAATAQTAFPPDSVIQRLLDERVVQRRAVGVVVATFGPGHESRVFHAGTTGRRGLPLNGEALFEIGSITKTFTAALLADMVRRGEVRLDEPVTRYLPASVRVPARGGREITLVDLATHTSGLPALPTNIHPRDISNPYSDYTVEMLDQFLVSYPLPRDIGAEYEYSAVGLGLLGRALGYRLGMSWEAAIIERVLTPLRMTSTRATLSPALRRRLAIGHDASGNVVSNWDIPALPGMGALRSTANDMLKYLAANLDSTAPRLGRALALAHVPRVVMDDETRVGLAWQTGHATNRTIVWHGGGTGGFRTLIAFDLSTRLGVVVLSNSATGADDIGFHLLDPSLPLDVSMRP